MALDKKIAAAVRSATANEGQPVQVANRLIAWLESLSEGNETLANVETTNRFLNDLFESIETDGSADPVE